MVESELNPYERPKPPEEKTAGNIIELLDRILDKGIVIVGDIRISVADIELLKIQIRLLIASVERAQKMGIDFSWAKSIEQPKTKAELEQKVKDLELKLGMSKSSSESQLSPQSSSEVKPSTATQSDVPLS